MRASAPVESLSGPRCAKLSLVKLDNRCGAVPLNRAGRPRPALAREPQIRHKLEQALPGDRTPGEGARSTRAAIVK
jgi:hypothetical protein